MKILLFCPPFVHPRLDRDTMKISPPLAIYYLGGMLIENEYNVTIYDPLDIKKYYQNKWDETQVYSLIAGFDVIGISTNSFNWGIAKEFIDIAKSKENCPYIVCGGVHASLFYKHIMKTTQLDFIIREDGEIALLKLIQALEHDKPFHDIPNLVYRSNDKIVENGIVLEKDISKIIPAYEFIPDNYYYSMPVETSRGCPFDCPFCSILYLRSWRAKNKEESVKHIRYSLDFLKSKSTANSILFTDDEFNINTERSKGLLKEIDKIETDFRCHLTARVTDFIRDEELARCIPKSKISTIQMGIECGYDEGLKKVKQGLTFDDIEVSFKRLLEEDVAKYCLVSFIVGFPWESVNDCIKTIEYAMYMEDTYSVVTTINWWLPLKSRLWDIAKDTSISLDAGMYDNPLWPTNIEVLRTVHKNLTINEIEKLTKDYANYITHLLDMV